MSALALAPLLFSACPPPPAACPDEAVVVVEADVCDEPCTIAFGEVTVPLQEQRRVSFQDVTIGCGFIGFFIDEGSDVFTLPDVKSGLFARVEFVPEAAETYTATLVFEGDLGSGDFLHGEIALRGTGVLP